MKVIKLLILEDSKLDAELTLRELRGMDHEFETKIVESLSEFEHAFLAWNPDLVISDFNLQSFTGDEALNFAKLKNPEVPVIMLSGSITKSVEVTLLKSRANDVLTKDNLKRLPFAVNRVLNEKADKSKLNSTLFELAGNLRFQEALADISLNFNSSVPFGNKINKALRILGETADVSRVYIFQDFNKGKSSRNTFEWCAKGVEPQIDNLQDLDYHADMPSLKPVLINDGVLKATDIQNLPQDMIAVLEPQEIKSLIIYPISVGEEFYGFVGFDEVRAQREWTTSEDKLLKSVSGIMSNAFSEFNYEEELKKTNKRLNKLLSEKELLVGEVHHRVKNNLALISGFLQLDQMGLGVKKTENIISANILRVKSIAIIHEIIYEQGNFRDISIKKTLERVLEVSFKQEKVYNLDIKITSEVPVLFNINQAVPFSLLISEMIFEVFRLNGDMTYNPGTGINITILNNEGRISIEIGDSELARIVSHSMNLENYSFSEIFTVLARQLNADIKLCSENKSLLIEFSIRDVKGASSNLN